MNAITQVVPFGGPTQFLWRPEGSPVTHKVRTLVRDGEPWFVGADVASLLGYVKPENALATHCRAAVTTPKQGGGFMKIIPERDVYRLIMRSKLPAAEQFEEWVVGTVLPSLRQNGGYIVGQESMSDAEIMARALVVSQRTIETERTRRERAEARHISGFQKMPSGSRPAAWRRALQTPRMP